MSRNSKKVVLVSHNGYRPEHDALLGELLQRRIEIFCAVGKDCRRWEDVMDELVTGPVGDTVHFVLTTSHPDESIDQVVAFARLLHVEGGATERNSDVEVIEVH